MRMMKRRRGHRKACALQPGSLSPSSRSATMLRGICLGTSRGHTSSTWRAPAWRACASVAGRQQKPRGYWQEHSNRRRLMEQVEEAHAIRQQEDWKQVKAKDIRALGGGTLLEQQKGSVLAILRDAFPERTFDAASCRPVIRSKHWDSAEARKSLLLSARAAAGLGEEAEEWAKLRRSHVRAVGGRGLLDRYGGSVRAAVADAFPECEAALQEATFAGEERRKAKPAGYWREAENQRAFMEMAAARLGVKEVRDWRKVSASQLVGLGGRGLLALFSYSLYDTLHAVYPDEKIEWDDVNVRKRRHHWSEPEARRKFLEMARKELGVGGEAKEWAKVRNKDILGLPSGSSFLAHYSGSLFAALQDVYPEQEWREAECRPKMGQGYWAIARNQREFFDQVAKKFNVEKPEDWQRVKAKEVEQERHGASVLRHFRSLLDALKAVYPEHREVWKDVAACRPVTPRHHWESDDNVAEFVEKLRLAYGIREKEDWARLSVKQVWQQQGYGLLNRMRLVDALRIAYPHQTWPEADFSSMAGKKSAQWHLKSEVQGIFPEQEVREDYLHPHLQQPRRNLELDVFLPSLGLALEYNGIHHYTEVPFLGSLDTIRACDEEKRRLCREIGLRLVTVPYWWDDQQGSLVATLLHHYPGLADHMDPSVVEQHRRQPGRVVEEKQPAVAASKETKRRAVSFESAWSPAVDATGMLVAKSTGGVRVQLSGGVLSTIHGRRLPHVPPAWQEYLPKDAEVDGTLTFAGGKSMAAFLNRIFLQTEGEEGSAWAGVRFVAVDMPHATRCFRERLAGLRALPTNDIFSVAAFEECRGKEHFEEMLEEVEGGDGLLLQDPAARYRYGRKAMHRVRKPSQATVAYLAKCTSQRGLMVHVGNGKRQMVRCSRPQYRDEELREGDRLVVGHYGTWPSTGRYKFPFLLHAEPKST